MLLEPGVEVDDWPVDALGLVVEAVDELDGVE